MTKPHLMASIALTAVLSLACIATRASADQTIIGPNSAYAAASIFYPVADSTLLSATIPQGKSGRVLVVQATIIDDNGLGASDQTYYYRVRVNGGDIEPTIGTDSSSALAKVYSANNKFPLATVTSSGTWWLDLDAAGLVGVPLTIELFGSTFPFGASQITRVVTVSFAANMVVK